MAVAGLMSAPRSDFQENLIRGPSNHRATELEAEAYVQGVRGGAVLVFASGSDGKVDAAAEIMNRHGPVKVEELIGGERRTVFPQYDRRGYYFHTRQLRPSREGALLGRWRSSLRLVVF